MSLSVVARPMRKRSSVEINGVATNDAIGPPRLETIAIVADAAFGVPFEGGVNPTYAPRADSKYVKPGYQLGSPAVIASFSHGV